MNPMQHRRWYKVIAYILIFCLSITIFPNTGFAKQNEEKVEQEAVSESFDRDAVLEKAESYTTYDVGNGERKTVFHGGNIRYENEDGELEEYDPSLSEIESGDKTEQKKSLKGYSYTNAVGDKKHYVPEVLSEETPIRMEYEDYAIEFSLTKDSLKQLSVKDKEVEVEETMVQTAYEDDAKLPINAVYGDESSLAEVTYTSCDDSIKETLVLNEIPTTNVFQYHLKLTGMKAKKNVTDGGITYYDEETEAITGAICAPWMNDASGDAYSEEITYELEEVEGKDGEYLLTMTIEESYLTDPQRCYPVTIDPTNTWKGSSEVVDVYVISGSTYGNTNFYESSTKKMPAGKNDTGTHRTYIKFLNLKSVTGGYSVSSAKFTAYETGTGASSQKVGIYRITESWKADTLTYNNRPTSSTCYDTITTSKTQYTVKTFDVTTFARNVANGSITNYGLQLYNKTSSPSYACFYGRRASSYKPKLVVTYHTKPTAASTLTVSNSSGTTTNYFRKGQKIYATWAGITSYSLSSVLYKVIAADSSTTSPTSVGSSGVDLTTYRNIGLTASSGTKKAVGYTSYLPEGVYRLYIRGKDAAGNAGSVRYRTFYVDATAPTLTNVKASVSTSPSSPTKNLTPKISWTASDTHFSKVAVSVDGGTAVTVATTSGSGSYTIPSGKITSTGSHTIKVTAYDQAGNTKSSSLQYYVDITAPTISNLTTSPATSATAPSGNLAPTVSWNIEETALASISISVNEEEVATPDVSETGYKLPEDLFQENGTYTIKLTATDASGNSGSKTVKYYVDIFAPVLSGCSISPDTMLLLPSANRSPKIHWNVAEDHLQGVFYSMDGEDWRMMGDSRSGSFAIPSDVWIDGNGRYTIYVKAMDTAGNESEIRELSYHLNNTGNYEVQNLAACEYYGKTVLTWTLDAFDGGTFAYDVYRSTEPDFIANEDTKIAGDIQAEELLYIDTELLQENTYYYVIKARYRDEGSNPGEVYSSQEVSVDRSFFDGNFANTQGQKDYLSYTTVDLPTGTAQIEESSGMLHYEQEDFSLSNAQLDYSMIRAYNSDSKITSMLGRGWMDSYHKEVYVRGEHLFFLDSNGNCLEFAEESDSGIYRTDETEDYELSVTGSGYEMVTKEKVTYRFNGFGQLVETSEPNGCRIVNSYDEQGRLISVTSKTNGAVSKALTFTYGSENGQLVSVKDLSGTSYVYGYGGELLTSVTVNGETSGQIQYRYTYSEDGRLDTILDGEKNAYAFCFEEDQVTEVIYPDGESLSFSYNKGTTIITKKTPDGKRIFTETTTYDMDTGKLLSHTDAKGNQTSYTYDETYPYFVHKITSVKGYETLEDGNATFHKTTETVVNTYDEDGNLTKESDSDGTISEYGYDEDDPDCLVAETTEKDGEIIEDTTYQYDTYGNMISIYNELDDTQTVTAYDEDGNEIVSIDLEQVEKENIISENVLEKLAEKDPKNQSTAMELDGTETVESITEYEQGDPVSTYAKAADVTETTNSIYDAMGREIKTVSGGVTTETSYDFLGRAVKTVITEEGKESIMTDMVYNGNGSLVAETVSGGIGKYYTYDCRNRNLTEKTYGQDIQTRKKTTAYGYEESICVEEGRNTRIEDMVYTQTVMDTEGVVTGKIYIDVAGNTVKEISGKTYVDTTYDSSGNAVVTVRGSLNGEEKELSMQLYDEYGNHFASIVQPDVADGGYRVGKDSIVTKSTFDAQGNLLTEMDGEGVVTTYEYDEQDRITKCVIGEVSSLELPDLMANYTFDETTGTTMTTIIDANGNLRMETVNAAGLTTSIRDEEKEKKVLQESDDEEETSETEDVEESKSITTDYEYDPLGRKTKETYSDGSFVTYGYEGDSERIETRDAYAGEALERTVRYGYDQQGRVTEIICIDGGDEVSYRAEYSYDVEGKKLSETVRYAAGEKETVRYVYDQEGRLVAKDYPDQTGLGTITYQYDSYGNCIGIDTEEGTVRESTYDGLGRVSVVRDYDIAGSDAYMETAYGYDLQGRVISMITEDETGTLLESFHYAYDKNDQILTMEHVNNLLEEESIDESRVYTYDDHGNLIESRKSDHVNEGSESTTTYAYDGVGNRICMQVDDAVTEYTYNGLDQMLSAYSGNSRTEYTYDARGNQVLEETTVTEETEEEESENIVVTTTEMEYAVTGEMLSLTETENGETTLAQRNVYDPDGIRICRMENGNTRSYYYDGGSVAYTKDEETVSGVNLLTLSGTVVGTYRGEDYYTYLKDVQGSSTNLVKEDGTLAAAYDYTDFGETTELTGSGFDNQICYTGGIYDEASKLYYLNARYYDPETGRFLAQDSYRGEMDDPDQWHLYVYCANNPINYVDPSGHWNWPVSFKYSYVRRGALATVLDGVIAACCGGWTLPAKKMLKDAFKKDIKKMKTKTKRKIKKLIYDTTKKVKNQLSDKGKKMWKEMNKKAKKIKNDAVRSKVYKFLNKPKVKNLLTARASDFVSGKVKGFVEQVLDFNTLDCVTSIGGFVAGIVEYQVDGYLGDAKIHF